MSRRRKVELLRRRAVRLAARRSRVLCRRELVAAGIPRWLLQLEVRAGRWQRTGRQTVVVHNGPLGPAARRAVAVLEAGPRAALNGVSALQQLGASTLSDVHADVIVPKGSRPYRPAGATVHESRRFCEADVVLADGVRTMTAPVAAVHGALWAGTDRQATFLLVLVVQQRLTTPAELVEAAAAVRRHPRRLLVRRVVADVSGGVRSMGELDVALAMRGRGLPEPERQVLRRRASGTEYLDVRFDRYGLALEIDGAQHEELAQRTSDVLRDFSLVADGDAVLRLPLLVWRTAQDEVLGRLADVLRSRGWRGDQAA